MSPGSFQASAALGWRFSFLGALPPPVPPWASAARLWAAPTAAEHSHSNGDRATPRGEKSPCSGPAAGVCLLLPRGGCRRSPLCRGTHKHGEGGCWHRLLWPSLGSRVFRHRRTEFKQGFLGHRSQMLSTRASYALTPFTSSSPSKAVGFLTQSTALGKRWGSRRDHFGHLDAKLLLDVLQAQLCGANGTVAASPALALSSRLAAKLAPLELTQVLMSMSLNCLSL